MNLIKKFLAPFLVVVAAIGICFRFFGYIIKDPGDFIFSNSEDGIKNYFTVFYQVLYGEGSHFSGSLFPSGDLHLFADGQPVLTWILRILHGPDASVESLLSSMNLIMIFSPILCAVFLYLILRKCAISHWFSIGFALIIAFLSPQLDRLGGHYALVYSFFIPAIWYFLLQMIEMKTKWIWLIPYCITVLLFSFNQPYYLMLATVLTGSILLWHIIHGLLILKQRPAHALPLIIALIFPIAIMMGYLSYIDSVIDRPMAPFGIGSYDASISGTFVPVNGPVSFLVRSYLFRVFDDPAWEARCFVGIPATLFLFYLTMANLKKVRKWGFGSLKRRSFPKPIFLSLIPAFFVLAFASGELHKLGLFLLYDLIPQLKQFRALGRLAWVFYYIFTVSAATYFFIVFRYLKWQLPKGSGLPYVVIFLVLGVWTVDLISNIKSAKNLIGITAKSEFRLSDAYQEEAQSLGINQENFQAILPLPFSLVGSEKLVKNGGPRAYSHSVDLALTTGLPMFGGHMSRTSWATTVEQSQLVSHPVLPKPFLSQLDDSKEIVLIWSYNNLTEGEKFIRDQGFSIWKPKGFEVYSVSVRELRNAHDAFRKSILNLANQDKSIDARTPGFPVTTIPVVLGQEIVNQTIIDTLVDQVYEISYWTEIDKDVVGTVKSSVTIDHEDGTTTEFEFDVSGSSDVVGNWVRARHLVQLKIGTNRITANSTFCDGVITPVQIRNINQNVLDKEQMLWNNYPIIE